MHILIIFGILVCRCSRNPLHPLRLFPNPSMARTHGGHSFRPRVHRSSPPPVAGQSTPLTATAAASHAPGPTAQAPRTYDTRVRPTPPSLTHPRPSRRAPPPTRARTSNPDESSNSRPQEPHSPLVQGPADDLPLDLSPTSIIRCPFFHRDPIISNLDCSTREVHCETYYDFPAFAADSELRDSMRLVQRYSMDPFITPRRFFYPRVVIEFYHTMTSKRLPHPTIIHFSIDGHEGTLQAADIAAAFHFPTVLANSADYRLCPHPFPREMVRILSRDVTIESILFRR